MLDETQAMIESQRQYVAELDAIVLSADAVSLDLLQAIYRDPRQPLHVRMRAAMAALPFEHPKLAVTAITTPADFAARLDAAIRRSEAARVTIDHEPRSLPPAGPEPTPVGAPMVRLRRL